MDLEMVLNELSLTPATDISTARQWMSNLISTLSEATANHRVKRVLRTQNDINTVELAPDYPVARWRNDRDVDREERRFLTAMTTKAPFWSDVAEEIKNDFDLSQVWHEGEQAKGLGFAWVSDALAVSLFSEERWNYSRLELAVTRLEDDELINEQIEIVHASCSIHVQEHADWIKKRIRTRVRDGSDLWNRRDELFPHLEFCYRVCEQMQDLRTGNPMLGQVVKRLFELEEYCKNWTSGAFNPDSLPSKATPESEITLQQFRKEHTFRCPDGPERIFSWHLRMTPGKWRLFFSIELGPGKIIIGHIGPKLPNHTYTT